MDLFERSLCISAEDLEFLLRGMGRLPWADFLLNPRRLRGSDFLMRWSQGVWSERRLREALDATGRYFALPYGPSGTAPENDVRAFELYFDRLDKAGLGGLKRPDLLVFRSSDASLVKRTVDKLGGVSELPFTAEADASMRGLLYSAILGIECENSLWRAKQMPDYGASLKPQRRLGGRPGLKKQAVLPTIILKEEDRAPLLQWQRGQHVPVHIWHAFYDEAFGISLDGAQELILSGAIEATKQTFQAPGGATSSKIIYKIYYLYAYHLATTIEEPRLVADSITDRNGHILPYVRFEGGRAQLTTEAIQVLEEAAKSRA
jgi:hypothetical protein